MRSLLSLFLIFSINHLLAQPVTLSAEPGTELCPGAEVRIWIDSSPDVGVFDWTFPDNFELIDGGTSIDTFIRIRAKEPGGGIVILNPGARQGPGAIILLPLVVIPIIPTVWPPIILCPSDFPFEYGGKQYSNYGNFEYVHTSALGCDSVILFSILPEVQGPKLNYFSCGNDFPIEIDGREFNDFGIFEIIYPTGEDCDSVILVNIEPAPIVTTPVHKTLCGKDHCFTVGDSCYQEEGVHLVRFEDYFPDGCDSVVQLNLERVDAFVETIDTFVCGIDASFSVNGLEIFTAGNHRIPLHDFIREGCDSIVLLNLDIIDIFPSPSIDVIDQLDGKIIKWVRPRAATHFLISLNRDSFAQTTNDFIFIPDSLLQSRVFIKVQPFGDCQYLPAEVFIEEVVSNENDYLEKEVTIYPNPTQDLINLETDLQIESIEIYDYTGKLISKSKSKSIDLSVCKSGVYMLKIFTNEGVLMKRFMKN